MKFETFKIEKELKKSIMSPEHPKWEDFCEELEGPEGCNFREENGITTWDCKAGHDRTKARSILVKYDVDIEKSLEYFTKNGGHCDCEILFNVNFN
jgi:hypothetical protein